MKEINISKEKIVMSITIGIACLTLMLVMFMQFKVVKQTDITSIESMREEELRTELSDYRKKYSEIQEKYEETMNKISEYQTEKESDEKTAKLLQNELEELSTYLGLTDVQGEGITIILTDNGGQELNNSSDEKIVSISSLDLLRVIRDLFSAGAEAISINDQRIVGMSDIFLIGSSSTPFIQVNGQRITSPYVIKAIGNKAYLESAVSINTSMVQALKEEGHGVEIQSSGYNKLVVIKAYTGTISTKYMKDKEE